MTIALRQSTASQEILRFSGVRIASIFPPHVGVLASLGAVFPAWSSWCSWFGEKFQTTVKAINNDALDTPGVYVWLRLHVMQRMMGTGRYFKIFRSVVELISVNVMNNFRILKRSTDPLAYDVSMLKDISTLSGIFMLWIGYQDVTLSGKGFPTSPIAVILATAIVSMYYKSRCSASFVFPQSSSAWSKFFATTAFANHFAISFVDSVTQSERKVKTGVLNVYRS